MKYEITGGNFPVVICHLEANETMITEKGAMAWMSPNMKMDTSTNGGIGKAFGRMFSGESMFQNTYKAEGGNGMIAFTSSFPGSIKALDISPSRSFICQKSAFLASEAGVTLSVHVQNKLMKGFFGGEGFIMQKLSGNGTAFIEIDGHAIEYDLAAGQSMVLDTGYLVAMDESCTMEVISVPGLKNKLLGGEGLFNTKLTGPGKIIVQTMPINQFAGTLSMYMMGGK